MPKQTAVLVDLVLVSIFAMIGVLSHHESLASRWPIAVWPFLTACLVAWAIMLVRKRPVLTLGAGIFTWLTTAWGGLAIRYASTGGDFKISFAIVTTVVLGLFLVGWRLLAGRRAAH